VTLSSYFGFKCPCCGSTVDIGVGVGDPRCPSCGERMTPNAGFPGAAANVYCPKCKLAVGLANSATCPQCGGPWSPMPV